MVRFSMSPEQMLLILLDMLRKALLCPVLHIEIFLDYVGGRCKVDREQARQSESFVFID